MTEMNEDYIYETFATFLNGLFDDMFFHVAFQKNNARKKYGTLYKMNEHTERSKKSYEILEDESRKENIESIEIFTMQIDLNSDEDNLIDYAKKIINTCKSQRGNYYFNKNGFTLKKISSIRDIPMQVKQGWEYRRSFDITVGYVDNFVFDMDYITTADIQKEP